MDNTRETPRSLDDLLEPGSTLMVGTRSRGRTELEFRPLTVARVVDDQIQVLLDTHEQWVADLVPPTPVEITLSDTRSNDWAHLTGTATLTDDPALIDELWNPFAGCVLRRRSRHAWNRRAPARSRFRAVLVVTVRPRRQHDRHDQGQGQRGRIGG